MMWIDNSPDQIAKKFTEKKGKACAISGKLDLESICIKTFRNMELFVEKKKFE